MNDNNNSAFLSTTSQRGDCLSCVRVSGFGKGAEPEHLNIALTLPTNTNHPDYRALHQSTKMERMTQADEVLQDRPEHSRQEVGVERELGGRGDQTHSRSRAA